MLHERAAYNGADHDLLVFTGKFVEQLRLRGIPMYVHTCYRSVQLQHQLYRTGKSAIADGAHQRGAAVDVIHAFGHWDLPDLAWEFIGEIGKSVAKATGVPMVWGGDMAKADPSHWELAFADLLPPVSHVKEPWRMTPRKILRNYRARRGPLERRRFFAGLEQARNQSK